MDPATLAVAATTFLAPYLAKAGGAILDRATAALPDEVARLWGAITRHFEGKPAAAAAATELVQNASSEDTQEGFNTQLKIALKNDPEFAAAIQDLLKKAGGDDKGGQNVNIGDVTNSAVVFGNNNSTNVRNG